MTVRNFNLPKVDCKIFSVLLMDVGFYLQSSDTNGICIIGFVTKSPCAESMEYLLVLLSDSVPKAEGPYFQVLATVLRGRI